MRHAELNLNTVYAVDGQPAVLVDAGKYLHDHRVGGKIVPKPDGGRAWGVLMVKLQWDTEATEVALTGLLARAEHYRGNPPDEVTYSDAEGFRLAVADLGTIKQEWGAHLASREAESQRRAAAEAKRADAKAASAVIFSEDAAEPVFAAYLEERGRVGGAVEVDILVPDHAGLLEQRKLWDDETTLAVSNNIELNAFMKAEADTTLRRGYGPNVYFTHLSTSRDLYEARRVEDGYLIPVVITFEVLSGTEYMRRIEAFGRRIGAGAAA